MIKRNLLVVGLAVLLSACGFQLRGTGSNELPLKELDLSARNAYGETVTQLNRLLTAGGVKIYPGAQYKLILVNEAETQRTASYSGSGRSAEYQLTSTLNFEIHGMQDRFLLGEKISVDRVYVHDGNNLTGSDQEAAQVRQEMRHDLIQRLLARLQQMTPEYLEKLQARADDVARAEEQARQEAQRLRDETPQQSPIEIPGR
ncbi:LPS assembly lipoprotein LptE [Pseudomonas sp. DTU_2021_1001937_2_SI_NGA_ILE_001]|uniref:LPS-assembly lipoprotein LptE n=1 Tax=Pseudomonas sp. DTU_2021_1001937_2_SI_NGA_ILE_001 TaxID=3077589 RepID=UPI0025DF341B|nr:LPS assembly lipoprotein LptE [Pseudomonas sp. DTU_2021_1001937_2_SI_NGA_ILE_001]WNW13300.1 LPS assembly lipoprotein LptE [Pseudomonas sp. DTU_2021_1001937_2_SI_NGA_ILE_001]